MFRCTFGNIPAAAIFQQLSCSQSQCCDFCLLFHIALSMLNSEPFQRPCKNSLWWGGLHMKMSQYLKYTLKLVWEVWMMNPARSVGLCVVSSEFTSGNCAKTLKKSALRRQLALCEADVQSVSLAFGFLPTAGGRVRVNRVIENYTKGPRCHIRSLTSSWNICSSPAHTFTEGGCCTASKGNCRTHLMFLAPHFCPPPASHLSPPPLSSSPISLL